MSYHAYWSLSKLPFGPPRLSSEYYFGLPQDEALARLEFLVTHGRSVGLLIGPRCSGRTTLLRYIDSGAWGPAAQIRSARIAGPQDATQLIEQIASGLSLTARSPAGQLREIRACTNSLGRSGVRTVLLVDDAERLDAQSLELCAGLASTCRQITLVLSCVESPDTTPIVEAVGGCPLRADLDAWKLDDCRRFIQHGISDAGGAAHIFTDAALIRLSELSGGLPGPLARLAELALLAGAGLRVDHIGPELIEAAEGELLTSSLEVGMQVGRDGESIEW